MHAITTESGIIAATPPGMIRPVVRIAATCLVLAATLAVLVGCGKSKPASVGPPPAPLLTAQAVADVGAIMLRQSDVPGMSAAADDVKAKGTVCGVHRHIWVSDGGSVS